MGDRRLGPFDRLARKAVVSRLALAASVALHLASLGSTAAAQDERPDDAAETNGWGEVIDPDGDCTVTFGEGRATVVVPGTPHDLSAELGVVNAPRVLREVEGDFIAEVTVAGQVKPGGESTVPGRTPYNGAGLLLWADGETYVRFERAGLTRPDGGFQPYANFEARERGEIAESRAGGVRDEPVHLRLERRGGRLIASVSRDGLSWRALEPIEADLPAKVKVGVAAVNSASEPFTAEFEGFAVFRRESLED